MHMLPITAKGMEGKRATARRERGQEGKAHRQMKRLFCIILNIHIRTHKCFQNNVFSGSPSLDLLILSLRVYWRIQGYTSHTHRHTHVLYLCLSLVSRDRGGFPLSLDVCTLCGWVVSERGRTVVVYPGTPGIIVSNLSVKLRPNKKDFTRFEIWSSQILILLTHSQELWMEFLISERTQTPEKNVCDCEWKCVRVCDCLKSEQPPSASAYGRG